jgi:hypothetical protein
MLLFTVLALGAMVLAAVLTGLVLRHSMNVAWAELWPIPLLLFLGMIGLITVYNLVLRYA